MKKAIIPEVGDKYLVNQNENKGFAFNNKGGGTGLSNWEYNERFAGKAIVEITKVWYDDECGYRCWAIAVNDELKEYLERNCGEDKCVFVGEFDIEEIPVEAPAPAAPTTETISWEDKTNMIRLGNAMNSGGSKEEFQKFVLGKVATFDGQAWDMFASTVQIMPQEMEQDIAFWKEVYRFIRTVDCNDSKFGFRSGMRIAVIQTICEELNLI